MMKVHCDDQPAPSMNPIQNKQTPRMAFSATQGLGAKTQGGKTKAPLPKNKASLVKNRVSKLNANLLLVFFRWAFSGVLGHGGRDVPERYAQEGRRFRILECPMRP